MGLNCLKATDPLHEDSLHSSHPLDVVCVCGGGGGGGTQQWERRRLGGGGGKREKRAKRESRKVFDLIKSFTFFCTCISSWRCLVVSTVVVCMGCEVGVATTPEAEEEEVRKQRSLPKLLHLLNDCGHDNELLWPCGNKVIG